MFCGVYNKVYLNSIYFIYDKNQEGMLHRKCERSMQFTGQLFMICPNPIKIGRCCQKYVITQSLIIIQFMWIKTTNLKFWVVTKIFHLKTDKISYHNFIIRKYLAQSLILIIIYYCKNWKKIVKSNQMDKISSFVK